MATYSDYLNSLNDKSVWVFTKQETDFDSAFLSTLLFDEMPNRENNDIEQYFKDNHSRYGIETDRHRTLVIPQLYGLLTKTPFYDRGGTYNKEKPTAVFDIFKNECSKFSSVANFINSPEYNTLKTEQILKLKIHAIIDTANNNEDYNILPIVFIYKVLKKLKDEHGINSISIDQLYTYVMTCKSYDDVDSSVEFIKNNCPTSDFVSIYKDHSRVLTCIKKNINLFDINSNSISINNEFDDYFLNFFMRNYDFEDLHEQLLRDVDYSYFLYNNQGFNINLIDSPYIQNINPKLESSVSTYIEDDDETSYEEKVNNINDSNVNEDVSEGAYNVAPTPIRRFEVGRRFRVNPLLGKIAIQKAYYCCENDPNHETFLSQKTNKNYMEAHHLVPVCNQQQIWDKYGINIDCVENMVSLCPNCHKAFHYGTKQVKRDMINSMYKRILPKYKSIGFDITLEEIYKLYKVD